jgi:hypothetical protein
MKKYVVLVLESLLIFPVVEARIFIVGLTSTRKTNMVIIKRWE